METQPLILASTSQFRRELLGRLGLAFESVAPAADETPLPNETANDLVLRLAEAKARSVASRYPDALIIGSDQVAVLDGQIIGKPNDHLQAVAQLRAAAGRRVDFINGLCLFNAKNAQLQIEIIPYSVIFRNLSEQMIENYLRKDQPYQSAGSIRSESLGVVLFERLEGDDPNALIGLPLIRLVRMLENFGVAVC